MTFTQAFKTSATSTNSHIQDNNRQDDHILATYDTTPGLKPFTTNGFRGQPRVDRG